MAAMAGVVSNASAGVALFDTRHQPLPSRTVERAHRSISRQYLTSARLIRATGAGESLCLVRQLCMPAGDPEARSDLRRSDELAHVELEAHASPASLSTRPTTRAETFN